MSLECELPAVSLTSTASVEPQMFSDLWTQLAGEGWTREGDFAVSRSVPSHRNAKKPGQTITTDSGPTIEIAPSPAETIAEIETQLSDLRGVVGRKLRSTGVGILGSGIHPHLGTSENEYYRYRTPRAAYDYAIAERGFAHRSILNVAATQEVLDVPFERAPAMLAVMHRLAGVILFLCRNDPAYTTREKPLLSVRPSAWKNHIPDVSRFAADKKKVWLPSREVRTWREYLHLLWSANPMFILGTKNDGFVYVPEHPTFAGFMANAPKGGWHAKQLGSGEVIRVVPDMVHVAQTDWTYMGLARLRLFWREDTSLAHLTRVYTQGDDVAIEDFLAGHLDKVLLENRSSAAPAPGDEMCSLAFVTGIIENFDAADQAVRELPYSFWLKLAESAEREPLTANVDGIDVSQLLLRMLRISREGLHQRSCGEEHYLEPLFRRVEEGCSLSERMLALRDREGMDAVVDQLLYKFD